MELRQQSPHFGDRGEIDRGVLTDRGVRTAAGFDAADALGRQGTAAGQEFHIFTGIDIVGDRSALEAAAHPLA